NNVWMSTQTTAFCLLSIAKMVKQNGGKSLDIEVTIDGKTEHIQSENPMIQRDLISKFGENKVAIKNNNDNVVFVKIINSGKLPIGDEAPEQRGFLVSVSYKSKSGGVINPNTLKQGEDFYAEIRVSNPKNENVDDIALTQIFPSGWEIVNTRFTDFGASTENSARYIDIKDDRIHFYFDLRKAKKPQTKIFKVLLNASYLGKYYLPGTQVEAMYDNDYFVKTKGNWIEVVK
ncbi:hypothetical protein N9V96_04085, partial [Polaribacter sp.]|nr:hypothetical protein [Polaribacter sp.]